MGRAVVFDLEQPSSTRHHPPAQHDDAKCKCSKRWILVIVALVVLLVGGAIGVLVFWQLNKPAAVTSTMAETNDFDTFKAAAEKRKQWLKNNKDELDSITIYSITNAHHFQNGGTTMNEMSTIRTEAEQSSIVEEYTKSDWGVAASAEAGAGFGSVSVKATVSGHLNGSAGETHTDAQKLQQIEEHRKEIGRKVPDGQDWALFTTARMTFSRSKDKKTESIVTQIGWHGMQLIQDDPNLKAMFEDPEIFVDPNAYHKLKRRGIICVQMKPEFEILIRENVKYSNMTKEKKIESKIKNSNCPKGHALVNEVVPWKQLYCDGCLKDIPTSSQMMSCRECDYNLCANCVSGPAIDTNSPMRNFASSLVKSALGLCGK